MTKFLRYIGTVAHRIQFELDILKLDIFVKVPMNLQIFFGKGKDTVKTRRHIRLNQTSCTVEVNETLKMHTTLYFDKKKKRFLNKIGKVVLIQISGKRQIHMGNVPISLAYYLNK